MNGDSDVEFIILCVCRRWVMSALITRAVHCLSRLIDQLALSQPNTLSRKLTLNHCRQLFNIELANCFSFYAYMSLKLFHIST